MKTETNSDAPAVGQQRLVLLDLFCCAGGAGEGYRRAGFDVVGVDIEPQPNNPHRFIQADALEYLEAHGSEYDFIHASPPCQSFTAYRRKGHGVGDGYENLIPRTRELLKASGKPYVIENVQGAPLENPTMLCGSSFGLDVRRHRMFETSFPVLAPMCWHARQEPRFAQATNRKNERKTVEVGVWRIPVDVQSAAMGIDWMTVEELSQAIPPAYTEFLGGEFLKQNAGAQPPTSRVGLPRLVLCRICAPEK